MCILYFQGMFSVGIYFLKQFYRSGFLYLFLCFGLLLLLLLASARCIIRHCAKHSTNISFNPHDKFVGWHYYPDYKYETEKRDVQTLSKVNQLEMSESRLKPRSSGFKIHALTTNPRVLNPPFCGLFLGISVAFQQTLDISLTSYFLCSAYFLQQISCGGWSRV